MPTFRVTCPSITDTYSARDRPCRQEESSQTSHPSPLYPDCPYQAYCDESADEFARLIEVYGSEIRVTLAESSYSIVVRSEHQFNRQTRQRLALRKHLYERANPALPYQGLACDPFDAVAVEEFDEYLGFVDMRLNSPESPLALGLLVPPRRYRADPSAFLITGEYGPLFGSHAFPATVYSKHDPNTSGAHCAQACLIMAVGALCDRGARLEGSHTLTYLAATPAGTATPPAAISPCVAAFPDPARLPLYYYQVTGLTPEQCFQALLRCRTNPVHLDFDSPRDGTQDRLAERYVEAYVYARLPVILFVHTKSWWPKQPEPEEDRRGHAVVIVGTRRFQVMGLVPADQRRWLITLDPGHLPFYEKLIEPALDAGWAFGRERRQAKGLAPRLRLLAVADRWLRVHASACVDYLRGHPVYQRELPAYFAAAAAGHSDYRIRLFKKREIWFCLLANELPLPGAVVQEALTALPDGRFWCVIGYHQGAVHRLWIFDAEHPGEIPTVVLDLERRGTTWAASPPLTNWLPRGPSSPGPPPAPARQKVGRDNPLRLSVISSCSIRDLPDLLGELTAISDLRLFDWFVLRDTDIQNLVQLGTPLTPALPPGTLPHDDKRNVAALLADAANAETVGQWVERHCQSADIQVAAFATYFPDITSGDPGLRDAAIGALTNTTLLAVELHERGRMGLPIVEFVCGSLLDPCNCRSCAASPGRATCFLSDQGQKLDLLCASLRDVVRRVRAAKPGASFYLAAELEPGPTYVLRDRDSLARAMAAVGQDAELRPHVGLNLDVAHMRIARVSAGDLEPYADRILHGHICDHPGMHTRDQVPGTHTALDQRGGEFIPYLRLLVNRCNTPGGPEALPFSGACALELEGCNRMAWIHQSVAMMRHLFETARNWD